MNDETSEVAVLLADIPTGADESAIVDTLTRAGLSVFPAGYVDGFPAPLRGNIGPRSLSWPGRKCIHPRDFFELPAGGLIGFLAPSGEPHWIEPVTLSSGAMVQRFSGDGLLLAEPRARLDDRPMEQRADRPPELAVVPSIALADIYHLRSQLDALRAEVQVIAGKETKIARQRDKADREATAAEEEISAAAVAAILLDQELTAPSLDLAEKLRQAKRVSAASEPALAALLAEKAANSAKIATVEAALSGAILQYTTRLQEAAAAEIRHIVGGLAEPLAQLIALENVQRSLCGSRMTFSIQSGLRPWSGSTLVLKLVKAIPDRLSVEGLGDAELQALARPIAAELRAQIEGGE